MASKYEWIMTPTGRKVHTHKDNSPTTLCGIAASVPAPFNDYWLGELCEKCSYIERKQAREAEQRYKRGCLAYTGISEETTCFGLGGEHDKCRGGTCSMWQPEDFMAHELAKEYAEAENLPWPPPDIDTLFQNYANHCDTHARLFHNV